ncbi:hypothetical protein B5M47_02375 [candidate division CPR3 bacterium 4484_211]|uniref:Glycosyltransferase RgtA/B/C/D-like domain-containing protein n=1 Tax=candidate division CPR3 bacterium 4484_211 TaxID=1968527 RepID=A0A1W9NXV3_UNCC3|nr:MAG: hypothetical protein B5M47_02375 [candidate division CPR3 bacterium 4484_211]
MRNKKLIAILAPVCVLLVSLALRGVRLESIPPGMHGDEAEWGLIERELVFGKRKELIGIGRQGIYFDFPLLGFYIQGLFHKILGSTIVGVRSSSVFAGVLTILIFYLWMQELFDTKTAFISSLLFAFSHWHIAYSRMGLSNIWSPLFEVLVFFLLTKARKTNKLWNITVAGFFAGFALYFHHTARIVPLIGLAMLGLEAAFHTHNRRFYLKRFFCFLGVVLLVFSPQLLYYLRYPADICARCGEVSIFSHLPEYFVRYQTHNLLVVLWEQLRRTCRVFFLGGDIGYHFYGYQGPLLSRLSALLFACGFLFAVVKALRGDGGAQLVASSFLLIIVLGGVFTIDAPSSQRIIGVLPLIFAATAYSSHWLLERIKQLRPGGRWAAPLFLTFFFGLLFLDFLQNYQIYFVHYIHSQDGWAQKEPATTIAKYLAQKDSERTYVYMLREGSWLYFNHGVIKFLAPEIQGRDVEDSAAVIPAVVGHRQVIYIMPFESPSLSKLKSVYPGGHSENFFNPRGNTPWFTVYEVGS